MLTSRSMSKDLARSSCLLNFFNLTDLRVLGRASRTFKPIVGLVDTATDMSTISRKG